LPKFDELCIFNSVKHCDLIFLTETWLHSDVNDSIINILDYDLYRDDRSHKRGGGVCIYSHKKHKSIVLCDLNKPKEVEAKWIAVNSIIYCLIYIPPSAQYKLAEEINDYIIKNYDAFNSTYPNYENVLLGDFNCFNVESVTSQLSLTLIVEGATRGNSLLDKIFVSQHNDGTNVEILDPLHNSDHNKLLVTFESKQLTSACYKRLYDFRQSHLDDFILRIKNSNFFALLFHEDVNFKVDEFYKVIMDSLSLIPQKRISFSNRDKPWMTPVLKDIITKRWNAYKSRDFNKYEHLKRKVKEEIQKSKKRYYSKLINKPNKSVWNVIKSESVKTSKRFAFDGTDEELATVINKNLEKILHDPTKTYVVPPKIIEPEQIMFTEEEVIKVLKKIDPRKTSSDIIPSKILILLSVCCPQYITHIFNTAIQSFTWPSMWKKATIIPLPKDRIPNYTNVRPISILSPLNKCLEKLFKSRLLPHYIKSIDKCQFGFIPSGSTSAAIIALLNKVLSLLDSPKIKAVSVISFDFKKAFDKVNHQLLLNKLSRFLPHNFIHVLSSYLKGRTQRVQINTSFSNDCDIDCGVPQGSVLSPLLFGLFINDLVDSPMSFCFKYADDSTFVVPHYTSELSADIKYTLDHVSNWCQKNKLELNVKKTQLLIIKKQSVSYHPVNGIKNKDHIKLLGVIIQENLKWNNHIISTVKSASSSLYLIRKCRNILTHNQLVILYNSYILSKLCYAGPAWMYIPKSLQAHLMKLYRRCHKIICGDQCKDNCLQNPLDHQRRMSFHLFQNIQLHENHPLKSLFPPILTNTKKLLMPKIKTDRFKNSFIPQMTLLYNSTF